ncbi:heterokaryon incompatibility protein-domain-containing protein [Nemania sp. FL0916]|nr:heterokaryon incompatibility protein-domain-containing protein [Nemania sp. FL0916]
MNMEQIASNSDAIRRQLYTPINHYQTRIIQLYNDSGFSDSPLRCGLHIADLLHPKFEGVGIRGFTNDTDRFIRYDALSYTWGDGKTTQIITCNGLDFPITENLSQALRALRASQYPGENRYLWVDAICINQADDAEKSRQVSNMFLIFKSATMVIAWLGETFDGIKSVLHEAVALERDLASKRGSSAVEPESNFWDVYNGMVQLYNLP